MAHIAGTRKQNNIKELLMEIIDKPITELIAAEYNPRELTKEQYKHLKDSLQRFGIVDPIIINKNEDRKNIVIGGHQRIKVATDLGIEELPCVELDLTIEKEKELNVRLNRNTGQWDYDMLANHFDLEELISWGFGEDELALPDPEPLDGLTDPDDVPEVDEPTAKLGDVWILGDHKLLCGDSTKAEDVDKLIGQEKIDLIFTDPPYGVSYTGHPIIGKQWKAIDKDDLRDEGLYKFLYAAFKHLSDRITDGIAAYIFHASSTQIEFQKALEATNFKVKQQLIWHKGHGFNRSDYHWAHEPLFYAVKGKQNNKWYGDRTQQTVLNKIDTELKGLTKKELVEIVEAMRDNTTVWEVKKDKTLFYQHPTQKPVDLAIKAIKNNTKPGDTVIDNFSGSGSTLMAAECTNRKCLALEFDPGYCDVIISRWENFTGKKAILKVPEQAEIIE